MIILTSLLITFTLVYIAISDLLYRKISNKNIIILMILILLSLIAKNQYPSFLLAFIALLTGFIFFTANMLGGGDVKLISVLTLSLPTRHEFYDFLMLMTILGGVITIVGLIFFRRNIKEQGVPYGVAIALAFIITNIMRSLL